MVWKKITAWYDEDSDTMQGTIDKHPRYWKGPGTDPALLEYLRERYPTKPKRKCNICGANLSTYNSMDRCRSHDVRPINSDDALATPLPVMEENTQEAPAQSKPNRVVPKIDTTDICKHDIIKATCTLCNKKRKK